MSRRERNQFCQAETRAWLVLRLRLLSCLWTSLRMRALLLSIGRTDR